MRNFFLLLLVVTAACCPPTGLVEPEIYRNVLVTDAGSDTLVYEGMSFGSSDDPIGEDEWGLNIIDSPVRVSNCVFYLDGGHGIGVWGVNTDIDYCVIEGNTFVVMDSLNKYVIRVGHDNSEHTTTVYNPVITGNTLDCVEADTYKHNLFLGWCVDGYVAYNLIYGGGYGIGIKNCDDTLVEHNEVFNTSRQAIVEKAGLRCEFRNNTAVVYTGTCYRITDDLSGRQSFASYWHNNFGRQQHEWQQVFSLSSPYDPISQGFTAHDNTYQTDSGWTHSVESTFYELVDFQAEFGQEEGSTSNEVVVTSVPEEE